MFFSCTPPSQSCQVFFGLPLVFVTTAETVCDSPVSSPEVRTSSHVHRNRALPQRRTISVVNPVAFVSAGCREAERERGSRNQRLVLTVPQIRAHRNTSIHRPLRLTALRLLSNKNASTDEHRYVSFDKVRRIFLKTYRNERALMLVFPQAIVAL